MVDSIAALGPSLATPSKNQQKNQEQIKSASQQFESLMISEMLKSARSDGDSSWLGAGEDDQAGQGAVDYAEQQLASVMSKSGGIGLSKFIEGTLEKRP